MVLVLCLHKGIAIVLVLTLWHSQLTSGNSLRRAVGKRDLAFNGKSQHWKDAWMMMLMMMMMMMMMSFKLQTQNLESLQKSSLQLKNGRHLKIFPLRSKEQCWAALHMRNITFIRVSLLWPCQQMEIGWTQPAVYKRCLWDISRDHPEKLEKEEYEHLGTVFQYDQTQKKSLRWRSVYNKEKTNPTSENVGSGFASSGGSGSSQLTCATEDSSTPRGGDDGNRRSWAIPPEIRETIGKPMVKKPFIRPPLSGQGTLGGVGWLAD